MFRLGENSALKARHGIKSTARSAIVLALVLASMVIATLWPFNFHNVNDVRILSKSPGVEFGRRGLIYESKPAPAQSIIDLVRTTKSMTIEICFQAGRNSTYGVDVLLAINDNHRPAICTIAQWQSNLIIRSRVRLAAKKNRYREIGVRNVFHTGDMQHLIISWDERDPEFPGTMIWLNGKAVRTEPSFKLISSIEQLKYSQLSVGNSLDGEHPWHGRIYALAIYSVGMNEKEVAKRYLAWRTTGELPLERSESLIAQYMFRSLENRQVSNSVADRNHLFVPTQFDAPQKSLFDIPRPSGNLRNSFYIDTLLNILGFMPFGALVYRIASRMHRLRHKPMAAAILTILAGGSFSFFLEFVQSYLPTRDSSLVDLVSNIIGAAAGILLLRATTYLTRRH